MKKIFAAAVAALLALSLAACGGTGSVNEEESIGETISETKAEEEKAEAEETEKKAETKTEAETEPAEIAEEEEISVNENYDDITIETEDIDANANIFYGTGYSLTADPKAWTNYTEYMTELIQNSDNIDVGIDISEEDLQRMGDCMFLHTVGTGTNFNVVVNEVGSIDEDLDLSLVGDLMEEQFSQSGIKYLGDEVVTVNGNKGLKISIEMTDAVSGKEMKAVQYMFFNGVNQYGITYTADKETYSSCLADFEAVLNTISFD